MPTINKEEFDALAKTANKTRVKAKTLLAGTSGIETTLWVDDKRIGFKFVSTKFNIYYKV